MTELELDILHSVNFNWTRQLRSIWENPQYHVPTLHASIIDRIINDLRQKIATDDDCLVRSSSLRPDMEKPI